MSETVLLTTPFRSEMRGKGSVGAKRGVIQAKEEEEEKDE